jgi:hypothetical protein
MSWGDVGSWGETAWGEDFASEPLVPVTQESVDTNGVGLVSLIVYTTSSGQTTSADTHSVVNVGLLKTLTAVTQESADTNGSGSVLLTVRPLAVTQESADTNSTVNVLNARTLTAVTQESSDTNGTETAQITVYLTPVTQESIDTQYSTYAVYLAVNYHIDNKSVTTYSNFNFIGACRFNGKTLFINENGLFEYGGLTDNGTAIVPSVKTGKMCEIMGRMGMERSQSMKRIPTSRISVSCDKVGGSIDLNVTEDNSAAIAYNKAIVHDGFATYDIPIGRGTKFNFLQLELQANACTSLNIESIEFNPVELRRRER